MNLGLLKSEYTVKHLLVLNILKFTLNDYIIIGFPVPRWGWGIPWFCGLLATAGQLTSREGSCPPNSDIVVWCPCWDDVMWKWCIHVRDVACRCSGLRENSMIWGPILPETLTITMWHLSHDDVTCVWWHHIRVIVCRDIAPPSPGEFPSTLPSTWQLYYRANIFLISNVWDKISQ